MTQGNVVPRRDPFCQKQQAIFDVQEKGGCVLQVRILDKKFSKKSFWIYAVNQKVLWYLSFCSKFMLQMIPVADTAVLYNFTGKIIFIHGTVGNSYPFLRIAGAKCPSRQIPFFVVVFCGRVFDRPLSGTFSLLALFVLLSSRLVDGLDITEGIFLQIKWGFFCGQIIWKRSK